ncbi:hypothetical protein [Shewanella gaetbuli]|uniref:Uncharacterized protein n=1 Tax=Shewanella gaetbuli TaxID=220752 RepID=A0A9X2CHZ9_9GAMM|nr:hypothetical protein [Shewanella gaetbuli]MCL1142547.1 hypothetical protein [Shewanella gaetbuli]
MIYELLNDNGELFAFEIESVYMPLSQIANTLEKIEGVSQIRNRKMFSSQDEIHIRFKFNGIDYIVWEPYGDNSRFWLGPDRDEYDDNIVEIFNLFRLYKPPFVTGLVGDLLSLDFKGLFRRLFNQQP